MNKHAQALGKKGGVAGRGAAKARTSEQASAAAQARWRVLDNDGSEVNEGDWIGFSYGTPPVGVRAQVVRRGKSLFALTPEHTPAECNLRSLRRYVGEWYLLPSSPAFSVSTG
jgi:hypothetical protein